MLNVIYTSILKNEKIEMPNNRELIKWQHAHIVALKMMLQNIA